MIINSIRMKRRFGIFIRLLFIKLLTLIFISSCENNQASIESLNQELISNGIQIPSPDISFFSFMQSNYISDSTDKNLDRTLYLLGYSTSRIISNPIIFQLLREKFANKELVEYSELISNEFFDNELNAILNIEFNTSYVELLSLMQRNDINYQPELYFSNKGTCVFNINSNPIVASAIAYNSNSLVLDTLNSYILGWYNLSEVLISEKINNSIQEPIFIVINSASNDSQVDLEKVNLYKNNNLNQASYKSYSAFKSIISTGCKITERYETSNNSEFSYTSSIYVDNGFWGFGSG